MATELSALAQSKTTEILQRPQLVLEIDGIEKRFGLGTISKYIKVGDPGLEIGDEWVIGGLNEQPNQLDAISLDGTTTTIAQQLLQDKGGASSVSAIAVALLVDEYTSKLITPGALVDDILGRRANVYLGYKDTAFPQDFIQIFAGIIDEVSGGSTIILNVAHPEQKKRGQVFQQISTELTEALRFRSQVIQGIEYVTRRDVVGTVSVTYTGGLAEANRTAPVVTVVGTAISVQIFEGDIDTDATYASHIRTAIEKKLEALELVDISVLSGQSSLEQTTQSSTNLVSDTTLKVLEAKGFLTPMPSEGLFTYVRIGDEVIQYTGVDLVNQQLTGCTREALVQIDARAYGRPHDAGDTVDSFYRIQGDALDLALKLMMSGGPEYFAEDVPVKSILEVEGQGTVANAIYFDGINVADKYGLVAGDTATIEGSDFPENNVTAEISEIVVTQYGSYITLDGVFLVSQLVSSAVASFKTKWNIWPEGAGLGMGGDEIDVPEFERIKETFGSSLFEYDFYLKDTVVVKDFVDQELMFPTGAFSLPRKGKISLGYTSPPIGSVDLKIFDSSNTTDPDRNRTYRGIARYFYNSIVFKYNESVLDDGKFLSGDVTLDDESRVRIPVGNRPFLIQAKGLRPTEGNLAVMSQLKTRFLDRFKFAAERIKIQAFYRKAFNSDVGDIISFGGEDLQIPDSRTLNKYTRQRLYEVVNRTLDIRTGRVTFDLVDTAYSIEGARFGVISPSSKTGVGSTTSELKIVNSYGHEPPLKERSKWTDLIGQKILVHWGDTDENDWDHEYETTLLGFKPTDENAMLIAPIAMAPPAGAVIQVIDYPNTDNPDDSELYKRLYVFTNPSVAVDDTGTSTTFEVDAGDIGLFAVGQFVVLHRDDADGVWLESSVETRIKAIVGNEIEVEDDLGITPDTDWTVELVGFPDGGFPYRYM